jgi:hypothetical protein
MTNGNSAFPPQPRFRSLCAAAIVLTLLSACGGGGGAGETSPGASSQTDTSVTGGAGSTGLTGTADGSDASTAERETSTDAGDINNPATGTETSTSESQTAPDAVSGLSATVEDQTVIALNWNSAARAARYDLYWSVSPGIDIQTANRIENVTPPFRHRGLLGGIAYHYAIRAINIAGLSPLSTEVSATLPPGAVSGFTVTSGDSAIALSWISTPNALGYRIYWAQSIDDLNNNSQSIEVTEPPFTHTGLQNGATYYYTIAALGTAGEGPLSSPISAQAQTPRPTEPREISAQVNPDDGSSAIITWQDPEAPVNPSDILYYNLYRAIEPGVAGLSSGVTLLAQTSAGFFIDSVPVTGIPYYYVVTAVTTSGEGSPSAEVSASPSADNGGSSDDDRDVPDGVFDCGEPLECWTRGSTPR